MSNKIFNFNQFIVILLSIILLVNLLFNLQEGKSFSFIQYFMILIIGIIWAIYVSFFSMLINKYFVLECPKITKENFNDPELKKKYTWLQLDYKLQFLEVIINLGFIMVYFKIIKDLFMEITNPDGKNAFGGLYKFFFRAYLTIKFFFDFDYKFVKCKDLSKKQCNFSLTKICNYDNNNKNCILSREGFNYFNKTISNNITILNAFLTVLFQTNLKNKINYLILKHFNNDNYIFSVPNI